MTTIDDILNGGSGKGKTAKFDKIGKTYAGPVVSAEIRQATDPANGNAPEFWPDGNPKNQVVIGLQTDERNPEIENDDGVRYIYIKAWGEQKKALQAAAQEAKGSPAPGDFFTATYVADGQKTNPAFNAPKLFKYTIKKGNPLDAVVSEPTSTATPAAPVTTTAPTQAGVDPVKAEQIKKLIPLGLDDNQIAGALANVGVTVADAVVVRAQVNAAAGLQAAAASSQGF